MTIASTLKAELVALHADEAQSMIERLEEAGEPDVLPRPLAEIQKAADRGLLFAVKISGRIEALAGIYDLALATHWEAGGTYVSPALRGFGLQRLFFEIRASQAVIEPLPSLISAIKPTNVKSLGNAHDAGFVPWGSPPPQVYEPCKDCDSLGKRPPCCCDYLILPNAAQKVLVKAFLARNASIVLPRSDNATLALDLKVRIATDTVYRAVLLEFASSP